MARLGAILDQFEAEAALAAELRPDAVLTLRRLRGVPLELVLLTNSGRNATDRLLQRFALAPFFRFVLSRNDVTRLKPAPEGLEQALGLLRMDAPDVIYVGDSVLDVQAAKAARLKIVSITSGVHPAEKLRAAAPDYVVDSLTEAADLLLTLSREQPPTSVHG
jgi:phosphoglycolate phosphatase